MTRNEGFETHMHIAKLKLKYIRTAIHHDYHDSPVFAFEGRRVQAVLLRASAVRPQNSPVEKLEMRNQRNPGKLAGKQRDARESRETVQGK